MKSYQVGDVYQVIDSIAPFHTQEKWDNSGILIGSDFAPVRRVLVTLDISSAAVDEAQKQGCDLIVSHHPVIFSPLTHIDYTSIVGTLCQLGIKAICCHTPLDIADGGLNDLLAAKLQEVLPVERIAPLTEEGLGRVLYLQEEMCDADIAAAAKQALGCTSVRFLKNQADKAWTERLGICTGSGASMLEEILIKCDTLLTGDVKHDRWYKAQELGIGLIDCGHYHTEILMVPYVAAKLREALPELEVVEFIEGDPVQYV